MNPFEKLMGAGKKLKEADDRLQETSLEAKKAFEQYEEARVLAKTSRIILHQNGGQFVALESDAMVLFHCHGLGTFSWRIPLEDITTIFNQLKENGALAMSEDGTRVVPSKVGEAKGKSEDAPPAPPQFKIGDRVANLKGRCGKIVALYPDQTLDLCVRWDGDPHSCYEMSRELRPAPADPAPPAPWTPKKGDVVYVPRAEWTVDAAHPGDAFVVRRHSNEALCKFADLELVRRSQEAKS